MKRAYEKLLAGHLGMFPCVALVGVRQCGKTTLLESLPSDWRRLDLERRADEQVVSRDPDLFLRLNPRHVSFDEAQLVPELFPALRVAIDAARREKGRFVITGSSSPALLKSISETLAGRVGVIEMAPLSWEEATGTSGRDSFLQRLMSVKTKPAALIAGLKARGSLERAHDFWWRGGYPEPWVENKESFRGAWTEQYIQSYLHRDIRRLFPGLDELRFRRFIELLAGLSGRILNLSEVARALSVSQPTARDYFDIASGTFLWRSLPAWSRDSVKRLVKHPRGYLRDTGLLHSLLRIAGPEQLLTHPQMGASWEAMVIEEIHRQFAAHGVGHSSSYYRSAGGAEVDLIVEGTFGTVAMEVKYTQHVDARDLRGLRDFIGENKARLGVVIHNDKAPCLYDDQIIGLPFTHL